MILFPISQDANPHCGLKHNRSSGIYFVACLIGNKLTEEEQWAKLKLVKEIAEEVWGE